MKKLILTLVLLCSVSAFAGIPYLITPTNAPGLVGQQLFSTGTGYSWWDWGTNAASSNSTVVSASASVGVTTNGFNFTPFITPAVSNWITSQAGSGSVTNGALVGDVTKPDNSGTTTLATVNANTGSFGDGANVPQLTVSGKGLVTAAGTTPVAISGAQVTSGTLADARLSVNVPLLNAANNWSGTETFNGAVEFVSDITFDSTLFVNDIVVTNPPNLNLSSSTNYPGTNITSVGVTAGYVPKADGSGKVSWAAESGSGISLAVTNGVNAITNGSLITLGGNYVPGSNVTFTTNVDGTISVASTAGAGGAVNGTTTASHIPYSSSGNSLADSEFSFSAAGSTAKITTSATNASINLGGGSDASGDSAFIDSRTLTGTGNAHSISHDTTFNRTNYAWNAIDIDGTCAPTTFDHFAALQVRETFPVGSTFTNLYGLTLFPTWGGVATNIYGIKYAGPSVAGHAVTNYGIYLDPGVADAANWGIYQLNSAASNKFSGTIFGSAGVFSSTLTAGTGLTVGSGNLTVTALSSGPAGWNSSHNAITTAFGSGVSWGTTTYLLATLSSKATYQIVTPGDRATTFRQGGGTGLLTLPASPSAGDYFDFVQDTAGSLTITNGSASVNVYFGNTNCKSIQSTSVGGTCRLLWTGSIWATMWSSGSWNTF